MINSLSVVSYTPTANFTGTDSFTYSVNDGEINSGFATVTIIVNAINDVPTAEDIALQTDEEAPVDITLAGDDQEGDSLSYAIVSQPTNGSLSGTAPNVTYTPGANFAGSDSFTYQVNDGQADSNVATVTISVNTVNDAPLAQDISQTLLEDTITTINLVATDNDQDTLSYTVLSQPQNGVLTGSGANLTYQPNANFVGTDSFSYRANDGSTDSNTASVSLTITAVNDTPSSQDLSAQTLEDSPVNLTLVGNDVDSSTLTYQIQSQPANGVLSGTAPDLIYTPNPNFFGDDSFTYLVSDGLADSATATVTITVSAQNDAPVAQEIDISTSEDTPRVIGLIGTDADGDTLTYEILSQTQNGNLSGSGDSVIYTPNTHYAGADSFTYRVNDGQTSSAIATVNITVSNTNDAPTAQALNINTDEDTPAAITLSGSDLDGDSITYVVATQPQNGTLTGSAPNLTYTPNANFNGSDSFSYRVNDGELDSPEAVVTIAVNPSNDAPVAQTITPQVDEDSTVAITLTATDEDGDTLNFEIITQPTNGSLSGTDNNYTYTPNADFNGSDSFTYRANDGTTNSNTVIVSITVAPVNDAPLAQDSSATTTENQAVIIELGASDIDGDPLSYTINTQPQNGTVILQGNQANYTPNSGFSGSDSFGFVVNDGVVDSNVAEVRVTVIQGNLASQITSTPVTTGNEGTAYHYQVMATDPDGDVLAYSLNGEPSGMTVNSGTGLIEWSTPTAGEYSVTVVATDNLGTTAQQIYTLFIARHYHRLPLRELTSGLCTTRTFRHT